MGWISRAKSTASVAAGGRGCCWACDVFARPEASAIAKKIGSYKAARNHAVGSAVVSTAPSRRPADWLGNQPSSLFADLFKLLDAFGETPKAAVETTALSNRFEWLRLGWDCFMRAFHFNT